MKGKKKEKNVLTKNRYVKLFPIVLILVNIGLVFVFNYLFNTYNPYIMVENNGFMLSKNELASFLNKEDIARYDNSLKTVEVHENEYIYQMALGRYANEEKEIVDVEYPLFINEGLSIVNYNDKTNLINKNLRRSMGSSKQVFSYGRMYELNNYEPIDDDNYLLLNYPNGVYINLFDLKIKTNANEYTIPVNSFVYFRSDCINYYERNNNNEFIKRQIVDVDFDSILSFYYESIDEQYDYKYEDFLIGLGKLFKEEEEVPVVPGEIIDEKDQIEVIDDTPIVEPINNKDEDDDSGSEKDPEVAWVKPSVVSTALVSNVYSAKGNITINDPASVIVKAPTFTIVYNGKTYSRKSLFLSGEYIITGLRPESTFDIVGQYTYLDSDMKTRKTVTFFSQQITTKSMEGLEPIEVSFELGDIYSRKIELKNFVITSDIKSETLRGIRSIGFTIDGENYFFSSTKLNTLLNGGTLDKVATTESLSSNREYDFEITAFDIVGNELKVLNNTGKTRTSKKMPSVVMKVAKNEIDYVILNIDLKNDDDVEVNNYRYVIANTAGKVIKSGLVDSNVIRIEDLDPNQIFTVKVFGDFDLDDGKGLRKDFELMSTEFTSLPITSLGFLNLSFDIDTISSSDINFKYRINTTKTDLRLIKLVKNIKIEVYNPEESEVVDTFNITGESLELLKSLEDLDLYIAGLESNTKYILRISSVVQQGETVYNLDCLHNIDYFETYKKRPIIDVEKSFVTNDMIDFDVRVIDEDGAILSSKVRVELRDNTNKLLASKLININDDFERITYKYLKTNSTYNIIFIADEFNETNNNSTFKPRFELARVVKFTEDGILGKIELNSAVRVANGENLADVYSETKWIQTPNYYTIPKTVDDEGNMHIYAKKDAASYMYDLSAYRGEYVTVSFKIKAITKFDERLYLGAYVSGTSSTSYSFPLNNIGTEEWKSFSYSFIVGDSMSGKNYVPYKSKYYGRYYADFIGFYINNVKTEEQAEYVIKDFMVRKSKEKVSLEPEGFELEKGAYTNVGGKNNSGTNNDYRIRTSEAIILEGDQVYEINFSDDSNYTAYIYFTDMNNKRLSEYGWGDSGRSVYAPANSKMYIMFRYYSGNLPINPEDIKLDVKKYVDRGSNTYTNFTYDFITTIKVNMHDLHNEIEDDSYYVRVSDKDGNELYVNSYKELVDQSEVINSLKSIDLQEGREYRVSLFIKIRDREYELDYFNISTDYETVGISTLNDWSYIQPNGNYIVLNDLDFKGYTYQALGWGYRYFYGMIDFQGYSATLYTENNLERIGRVEESGVIKNLVLNVHLNNEVNNNNIRGFVESNYGTIENILVNVYDERTKYFDDLYINMIADTNQISGTIRNFAINIRTKLNLYWNAGLVSRTNNGTIENGYVQGENAFVTNPRNNASARSVALIESSGGVKSVVRNVYVLSSIEFPNNYSYDLTGLVAYETYGKIENVYTTGEVNTIDQGVGPVVGYVRSTAELNNVYYLNDTVYTTLNQNKIPVAAISDLSFQKGVLKSGFNIDEMIELGYYPQVKYTYEKMPKQDYVELPKVDDRSVIEILNIEVVSKTNNSAIVDLTIQNEYGDEITNVAISNLTTNILSQTFEDGKSFVRIEVSNPEVFVSKYEIRGVSTKSYNNIISERKYPPGDKYLFVEMYREINTVEEWYTIERYLNQNFAIMADLDFSEYSNYYISNYKGTIKGNNHVLRNINIVSDKTGLFNQMNGTLKDIRFENVVKTSNSSYSGIAGSSNQYGRFENVHVKNISITIPSSRTSNYIYIGGLVGNISYTKFTNCSVSDVKIRLSSIITDVYVGGMVGYSNAGTFDNVYVQNADIEVINTISTQGVGGLVGREVSSVGSISNAYTTGRIYSNGRFAGGIVGNSVGYTDNTYSMVNVISESKDVGGIVGRVEKGTLTNNNLFIGNVASKLIDTSINRIIGNFEAEPTNYALDSLLINGVVSDKVNGETLLSISDLLRASTYNNDSGLQLGKAFDYSQVSEGIIPKLYYMDTETLLPYQEDIYFYKDLFDVDDIVIDKHADFANVVFYLKNPNEYVIDDIVIDDMETSISQISNVNGMTVVTVRAVPNKYYDSYYAREIKYHIDGSNEQLSFEKMLFLEMTFYKYLRTFEDWQNVSKSDAENYILLNDIDFTGLNFNRDVVFNRLETVSDDEVHTLKGMKFNYTSSKSDLNIIKKVMTSIKNIKFEDIDIQFLQSSNNDYTNIICYVYGEIKNVYFENVTINAPSKNRVAMIGRAYTQEIDGVHLKDITVTGRNYVAGFLAYYENALEFILNDIEGENITVEGSGNYIGGLFTNFSGVSNNDVRNITNISIKDSTVKSTMGTYVGGLGAYAGSSDSVVDNVHVIGRDYVGGAYGYANGYKAYNITVKNSTIEGSLRYIGGVAGQFYNYLYDSLVYNTTVTGTGSNTYGVGGYFGLNSSTCSRLDIRDSYVNNNGDYTGGVVGINNGGTLSAISVDNVTVNGANYVGGLIGDFQKGTLNNDRVASSNINAQSRFAGGLVGYYDNSVSGTSFNEGAMRNCMVQSSNITSARNAGGIIGAKNEPIYNKQSNYAYYFDGTVTTTDNDTAGIGSGDESNSEVIGLGRVGIYENSLINNVPIKNYVYNTIDTNNLITNIYTGFVNDTNGEAEVNYNYPDATYTDYIKLYAGKSYLLTAKNKKQSQIDSYRVRLYDENYNFVGGVGWSTPTMNYLGTYYNTNYVNETYFTPVKNVYIRITYLYELKETSLVEISSTYDKLLTNRLLTAGQLHNRIIWNRYMSNDNQDFGSISYFSFDNSIWDFSKLKNEVTNIDIIDKSGNNRNAKASVTSIVDDGVFVGGLRDEIRVSNFTPENDITISTKIESYASRSYQFLFGYRDSSNSSVGFGLFLHSRTLYAMVNGNTYSTGTAIPMYKEVSVTMTYSSTAGIRVYVDGSLVYTNTSVKKTINKSNNAKTYIANDTYYTGTYKFLGVIKRVDVYNRVLDEQEVNSNYYHSYGVVNSEGLMLSYDFSDANYEEQGHYPTLINVQEQLLVPLPTKSNGMLGTPPLNTTSEPITAIFGEPLEGNYHIYPSSIDTINLEFDIVSNDLSFTYHTGDKSETVKVNKRVYTLKYDYDSDATITIKNAFEEKVINLNKDELRRTIGIHKNNYYYIKDNKLYNKDNLVIDNAKHIYKNLVLLNDNKVYNLDTSSIQNVISNNQLITNTIPLYIATIDNKIISTYYNFTDIIDADNNETIKDYQIIYKDGYVYIVDLDNKDNANIVVNNYNGSEYQLALGFDKELYSYKTSINMHSSFINTNIKEIYGDFDNSLPIIMIRYDNDEILVLNYYNGESVYNTGEKQNVSLLNYIGISARDNNISANNNTYNENNDLKETLDTLTDKEITEILNNTKVINSTNTNTIDPVNNGGIGNGNTVNNKYIVSYNEKTGEYVVYDIDDVLLGDSPVTVNSRINSNKDLYNYFYSETKINEMFKDNRVLIYIAIIVLIIANLVYFVLKYRRKEVVNE